MTSNVLSGGSNGPLSAGGLLVPVPVKTSAYTANPGEFVPVSTAATAVTVTLPAMPPDGTMVGVKMVAQGSTNAVTVACGGADTINTVGGSTSGTLSLLKQGLIVQYSAPIAVWYVLDDSLPAGTSGAQTFSGVITANAGTSSAGSAPVLTPTFASGTAAQLSDLTRDYMVMLAVTTSGTATSVAIGPTSTPANTILPSSSVAAGQLITFRLPAGWYVKWSGTTTAIATQTAIGC